jgi:hypothetical protein
LEAAVEVAPVEGQKWVVRRSSLDSERLSCPAADELQKAAIFGHSLARSNGHANVGSTQIADFRLVNHLVSSSASAEAVSIDPMNLHHVLRHINTHNRSSLRILRLAWEDPTIFQF